MKKLSLRSKEDIVKRAIALRIVAVKGEGLDQDSVEKMIDDFKAKDFFTPKEK